MALRALQRAAILAAVTAGPAAAQSPIEEARDAVRDGLREGGVIGFLTGLVNFGALPDIASANFSLESGDDLATLKLPYGTDVAVEGWPVDLHLEGGLGYLTLDQALDLGDVRVEADWQGVSGFLGGGPSIALGEGTRLRPIVDVVASYIQNDADYDGTDAGAVELSRALLTDIFFDAHLATAGVALALELEHEEPVGEDGSITLAGRYTHLFAWSFAASDDVLEGFGQSDTLGAYVELAGATPFTIAGRDLRWNGVIANTTLIGSNADTLGFDMFFEVGGGLDLALREDDALGVRSVGFRIAGITGNDVTGWTVGLRLDF